MHSPTPSTDRYVPFKQEGWGIALFVVLLAVVCAGTATYIHKRTYLHPTDTRHMSPRRAALTSEVS